jgi:hypothetical protein
VLIIAATFILLLPAVASGHPFIFWDSPTFYSWGHDILAALRHPWPPLVDFPSDRGLWVADPWPGAWNQISPEQFELILTSIGARSEFYAVPVYVLGSNFTLWAPAVIQTMLVAWIVWVTSAVILSGRRPYAYIALVVMLTFATSAPFFAAFIMPDVFSACGLLAVALLFCFFDRLRHSQRVGCILLVVGAVLVHLSNLPVLIALIAIVAALTRLLHSPAFNVRGALVVLVTLICSFILSSVLHVGLGTIFGEPVRPPPYLEGRVIADGPGQTFLREICPQRSFAACRYKDLQALHSDDIIFPGGSIITDPAERRRFLDEQTDLVLGTVRNHPIAQVQASFRNAVAQVKLFTISSEFGGSLWGLLNLHSDQTLRVEQIVPSLGPCLVDPQACNYTRPLRYLEAFQYFIVVVSLAVLAFRIISWIGSSKTDLIGKHRRRLALFVLAIVGGIVINGIVCGVVAGPWPRYQARVIWLVPMLAMLLEYEYVLYLLTGRPRLGYARWWGKRAKPESG